MPGGVRTVIRKTSQMKRMKQQLPSALTFACIRKCIKVLAGILYHYNVKIRGGGGLSIWSHKDRNSH